MILWYQGHDDGHTALFDLGEEPFSKSFKQSKRASKAIERMVREYEVLTDEHGEFEGHILDWDGERDGESLVCAWPVRLGPNMTLGLSAYVLQKDSEEDREVPFIVTANGRRTLSLEGKVQMLGERSLGEVLGARPKTKVCLNLIWLGTAGEYALNPLDGIGETCAYNSRVSANIDRSAWYQLGKAAESYAPGVPAEELGKRIAEGLGLDSAEALALKEFFCDSCKKAYEMPESREEVREIIDMEFDDSWGTAAINDTVNKFLTIKEEHIRKAAEGKKPADS
jgi:hypothetical protein